MKLSLVSSVTVLVIPVHSSLAQPITRLILQLSYHIIVLALLLNDHIYVLELRKEFLNRSNHDRFLQPLFKVGLLFEEGLIL